MLQVRYTADALKDLKRIVRMAAGRITAKLSAYAGHPAAFANQVKRLKGSAYLRLRVGDYRVVFTEDGLVLDVIEIGHRREIYR